MKIVEVWPRGYAHQDGTKRIEIEDNQDAVTEVRKQFGGLATIFSVRPKNPPPVVGGPFRGILSCDESQR